MFSPFLSHTTRPTRRLQAVHESEAAERRKGFARDPEGLQGRGEGHAIGRAQSHEGHHLELQKGEGEGLVLERLDAVGARRGEGVPEPQRSANKAATVVFAKKLHDFLDARFLLVQFSSYLTSGGFSALKSPFSLETNE